MIDNYTFYISLAFAFIVGTCIGSFVTMASHRIPHREDIVFKPSYCPLCNAPLKIADLFPLFSWLYQRGRCRHCHARISARYPLSECVLGIAFVLIVLFYGLSVESLFFALLATELLIIIVIDFEHMIIPDSMQIALIITGIAYDIYRESELQSVLISVAFGLALGLGLHYGYLYLRRKDALGFGDVKFLAVAGIWLPLSDFVAFLFLSGLIGIFTGLLWRARGKGAVFPFGPALACSLFITVMIPDILSKVAT